MKSEIAEELLNEMCTSDPNLTQLILMPYYLTDEEMKVVAQALRTNHSITYCDLGLAVRGRNFVVAQELLERALSLKDLSCA